ncbi:MAG TPA: DNA recombination/repair protein RecA, partial [Aquirhabdus sp.]
KFYASVRLDIRRIGQIKEGDEIVGSETKVKVVKNKVAPPFREALFQIMYGQGTNRLGEIVDWAAKEEIVQKSGAWYAYNGAKIGQGKNNVIRYFEENPAVAEEIDKELRKRLLTKAKPETAEVEAMPEELLDA